jgi:hypothetical protein
VGDHALIQEHQSNSQAHRSYRIPGDKGRLVAKNQPMKCVTCKYSATGEKFYCEVILREGKYEIPKIPKSLGNRVCITPELAAQLTE